MNHSDLVSIIIVNYNGKPFLEKCLKSVFQSKYENFEVILVDNNSNDDSTEFVKTKYPNVKIILLDSNYGFAKPGNIGVKIAKGHYLLFLNNDTIVTPDTIGELIKTMEKDPKIVICQSLLLKSDGMIDSSGDFIYKTGRAYSSREICKIERPILSSRGAAMMVLKDKFFELGGFDERFFVSFEDVDLGWRAWIWGYQVVLSPKSIVYHLGAQTVKNLKKIIQFHGTKNFLILRLTNFEFLLLIESMIFLIPFFAKRKLNLLPSNFDQISEIPSNKILLKAIFWILKNFRYVLSKRKQVNSRRVRSSKELVELGLIT